jgi:hypothetical protein
LIEPHHPWSHHPCTHVVHVLTIPGPPIILWQVVALRANTARGRQMLYWSSLKAEPQHLPESGAPSPPSTGAAVGAGYSVGAGAGGSTGAGGGGGTDSPHARVRVPPAERRSEGGMRRSESAAACGAACAAAAALDERSPVAPSMVRCGREVACTGADYASTAYAPRSATCLSQGLVPSPSSPGAGLGNRPNR